MYLITCVPPTLEINRLVFYHYPFLREIARDQWILNIEPSDEISEDVMNQSNVIVEEIQRMPQRYPVFPLEGIIFEFCPCVTDISVWTIELIEWLARNIQPNGFIIMNMDLISVKDDQGMWHLLEADEFVVLLRFYGFYYHKHADVLYMFIKE